MKRKHFFACLLLLAMIFGVVSCGSGGGGSDAQPGGQADSQPSSQADAQPSTQPSSQPSNQPSSEPSSQPSSQPDVSEAPVTNEAPPLVLPSMITLGTHPTGSLYNSIGSGLATVATRHTTMEVKVSAMSGPVEWMPMFATSEIEMGVLNCWDAQQAWLGGYDYDPISRGEGFPVRLVTNGSYNIASYLVAGDSDIYEAEDLYGKSMILNVTGSAGITMQNEAFLANQQLDRDRITMVSATSITDGVDAVIEGRADATSVSTGVARTEELDATRGARFIDWDPSPEAVARAREYFPIWVELVEPGPGRTGVVQPTYMMHFSNYLVSRTDVTDDVVYAVVQALWENYEELAEIHPGLAMWTADRFVIEDFLVPYHPGAIRFYKELGVWTDAMEAHQQELLALEN